MLRTILLLSLFLIGLQAYSQRIKPPFLTEHNKKWVDSIFQTLTLEEKIGQLLLPRGNYSGKPHDTAQLKQWVKTTR